MTQTPESTFAAALGELRTIRGQLVPGRAGPGDVEALTARAAAVVSAARAALRRAGSAIEVLGDTAAPGSRPDVNR